MLLLGGYAIFLKSHHQRQHIGYLLDGKLYALLAVHYAQDVVSQEGQSLTSNAIQQLLVGRLQVQVLA